MKPEDLRAALREQAVPEHRPGFWDDLEEQLASESTSSRRWAGWQVAVSAAAAVFVVGGVAALLVRQASVEPVDGVPVATDPATTGSTGPTVTTLPPPTTTEPVPSSGLTAPWDGQKVAISEVAPVLVDEWRRAENQLWCSALYPAGFDTGDATIRSADFGGGWAIAWDLPGLRSAFGVAGVGLPAWEDIGVRQPNTMSYGDQIVGYGGEGFDAAADKRLAEFAIPGQLCGYQVWSELGDEHLLDLIDSLRLVEGLEAEPIGDVSVDFGPFDRGPAPWAEPAVPYPDGWPAAPTETLAFLPTAGLPAGASVRTTTTPMWSLAWDAEGGPGHDGFNLPCVECGRGVIGISVSSLDIVPDTEPDVRWDDGSFGVILPRIADPAIPLDRVRYRANGTDELVPDAPRIDIYIPDHAVVVSVWSHLGLDSLFELVDGLRLADPGT